MSLYYSEFAVRSATCMRCQLELCNCCVHGRAPGACEEFHYDNHAKSRKLIDAIASGTVPT